MPLAAASIDHERVHSEKHGSAVSALESGKLLANDLVPDAYRAGRNNAHGSQNDRAFTNEVAMLRHILKMIEEYVSAHGRRPQVVCLNPRHMRQFMAECPDLFDKNTAIPLGFRILVLPESELAEPKAIRLRRRTPKRSALPENGPALISWTAKAGRRTKA